MQLSTIGFDLGVHGIDADERLLSAAAASQQVKAFFEGIAPVPCRHGGMRYGPSLGL
jgi:hypothetical protein